MNSTSEVVNHLHALTLKLTPSELETLRLKLEVEAKVSVHLNLSRPNETALLVHQYSLHLGRVVFKDHNNNSYKLINTYWMWDGTTQYVLSCTNNDDIPEYTAVMPIGTHSDLVQRLNRFVSDYEKYLNQDPSMPLSILLYDYRVETVEALRADLEWALDNLTSETCDTPQWAWDCSKYYFPEIREMIQKGLPINP
jgi:hypothetical protein